MTDGEGSTERERRRRGRTDDEIRAAVEPLSQALAGFSVDQLPAFAAMRDIFDNPAVREHAARMEGLIGQLQDSPGLAEAIANVQAASEAIAIPELETRTRRPTASPPALPATDAASNLVELETQRRATEADIAASTAAAVERLSEICDAVSTMAAAGLAAEEVNRRRHRQMVAVGTVAAIAAVVAVIVSILALV